MSRPYDTRLAPPGTRCLRYDDADYPASLRRSPRRFEQLYCRGDPRLLHDPGGCIAIVGARAAYRPQLQLAQQIAKQSIALGKVVVSGGAIGVDAAAHEGALAAGGKTVVILGSSLDDLYPPRNRTLFEDVVAAGGLLLTPFASGTPPRRANFPVRNGLVAASSRLLVVVAAAHRSGALSTARHAKAIDVRVAACPGSAGCDALLAQRGAFSLPDAAALERILRGERADPRRQLTEAAAQLLDALASAPKSALELALELGRPLAEVTALLMDLELDGLLSAAPGGRFVRISGD